MKHVHNVQQHRQREVPSVIPLPTLHDLHIDSLNDINADKLDVILPQFFIPELKDRPQDPIVDALESLFNANVLKDVGDDDDGSVEQQPITRSSHAVGETKQSVDENLWTRPEVIAPSRAYIHTWDNLPHPKPSKPRPSPFLSEQPPNTFDAIRYHVNYRLKDPAVQLQYILPDELWANLQLNLLGNSSSLFVWDQLYERLVPKIISGGAQIRVTLEGVGHDTIASVLKGFLNIGTNIRRIDNFVTRLQQNRDSATATMHAFSYSLDSVLSYVQVMLSQSPPFAIKHLVGISGWYRVYDQILTSLVLLCHCIGDPPFRFLPKTPSTLLDHIYKELQKAILLKSPREVTATLAYILTTTSRHYFRQLSSFIGLVDHNVSSSDTHYEENDDLLLEPGAEDGLDDSPLFPSFFPESLVIFLPAARKSLSILKSAGLRCWARSDVPCTWVWTDDELDRRWLYDQKDQHELDRDASLGSKCSVPRIEIGLGSENPLSQFAIFDLQPGSTNDVNSNTTSNPDFTDFLATFPETLPIITPTLSHLTELVLKPLSTRITVLSNLSLRLFLDSLHLETHLRILRSYFFLISSSFKSRLVTALFHDESTTEDSLHGKTASVPAIGLAQGLGLSNKKVWPPKGSDLSFSLRNVIVNSLEEDLGLGLGPDENNIRDIIIDTEQNLGFGLRDLPLEDGKARWLDPVSIEALDFLYLDYKTSRPLDVVVTPQIIAKYQRVFTYLLRLTRAGIVMRISYRNIYSSSHSFLPYASKARAIARNLYFQLQTFLNSLNGYTYDSVIGGTFDKYLLQIENIRDALHREDDINLPSMNIFVLGESHSRLLDRILRCCLLRGGSQKFARDALRDLLDLVLQFGGLLADLRVGAVKDFEAGERMVELNEAFKNGMLKLILGIRQLQETHDKSRNEDDDDTLSIRFRNSLSLGESNSHTRDQLYLDELLTRLDPSYWWRRQIERRGVESP